MLKNFFIFRKNTAANILLHLSGNDPLIAHTNATFYLIWVGDKIHGLVDRETLFH